MLIVTGTALVLVTWAVCLASLVAIGLPLAAVGHGGPLRTADLGRSLWWGLLALTVVAYAGNLLWPLGSGAMAALVVTVAIGAGALTVIIVRRRGWHPTAPPRARTWILAAGLVAAVAYLAVAALGPVTNYDSGLYHLGAIRYAAEYATIPGLANLYFPFGYGNAEFPLAALLGNGPWGGEGFRLLNGLVIAGVCLDLVMRAAARRHGPGFPVLVVGSVVLLVPMVALSDYWVTSPSQDSAVFAVTVAASAYVADAVRGGKAWVADAAVAGALGVLLVLLRPTMAAYLLAFLAIVVMLRMRRGTLASARFAPASAAVLGAAVAAAAVATARDYLLSGWLQYPLSVHAFDVPWRAPDPTAERGATLGFHRDPTDIYGAAEGWGWVVPWFRGLPEHWETGVVVVLLVSVLICLGIARGLHTSVRWRGLVAAAAPSLVMTAAWWLVSPPSFRFAWGPVFTSLTVPLGWILWRLATRGPERLQVRLLAAISSAASLLIVGVVVVSASMRLDVNAITQERTWSAGVQLPYVVAPVPRVETRPVEVSSSLVVDVPITGEQCWQAFPLCTPRPLSGLVTRRGDLQSGLVEDAEAG